MSTSGVEIGSVVSQALPAEEEQPGREERRAGTEGEERAGDHRGSAVRCGEMELKQRERHGREEAELWAACEKDDLTFLNVGLFYFILEG